MAQPAKQVGPYRVVPLPELKLDRAAAKNAVLSVRIPVDLNRRMHEACEAGPYRVGVSALVHRGIELAIKELAALQKITEE